MKITKKKSSIVKKMIFIFLLTMLFPSILISNMYYNIVGLSYKNNLTVHFNTVFEQYVGSLEHQLEQYEQLLGVIRTDKDIAALVKEPDPGSVFDISSTYMQGLMHDGQIFRCAVYSENATNTSEYSYARVSDEEWFKKSYVEGRYSFWFADETSGRGIPIISTVYPVRTGIWEYAEPDGMLRLDLYTEKIIGKQFPKDWQGIVDCIVFLDDGQVIWENGQNTLFLKNMVAKEGAETLSANTELGDFLSCRRIGDKNIYILCRMQQGFIKNSASSELLPFILQFGVVILSIIMVLGFYMKSFSKRINGIIGKIKKIEQLDFSKNAEDKGNDEFSLINDTLDTMSTRLNELIYENYEQKLQVRDTELKMLYFQINPHFLYNVLESISEIAYIEGSEKAADMSQKLGKMFRYTTETSENDRVSFEEELKYIQYYIEIQNVRFDDKFTLLLDADEAVMKVKILKFSLQPVVENAVKHAFSGRKSGLIEIKAAMCGGDLVVTVKDNGCGMSEEVISHLKESLVQRPDSYEGGIGIKNVNNRLIKAYGEDYGLEIRSCVNDGTEVILKFKIKENPDV
ncbi:MAG: sensor histidine kinase [Clostridia bacterium]|nr:sensor histidine kinase [Clostridia bacterium]MBP3360243.1 sensor histidine kinase [Clostridia bacterium]